MQINPGRMAEIEQLVDDYNEETRGALTDALCTYEATIDSISDENARREMMEKDARKIRLAAKKLGMEFDELVTWFRQWNQENYEDHIANIEISEEKLRDSESYRKESEF